MNLEFRNRRLGVNTDRYRVGADKCGAVTGHNRSKRSPVGSGQFSVGTVMPVGTRCDLLWPVIDPY